MSEIKVMGVDIGGTKIAVCVADENGNVLGSTRIPMQPSYEDTLPAIYGKAHQLLKELNLKVEDISACGICAPGPLDVANGMLLRSPNMQWGDVPFRDDLAKEFSMPIMLENDANAGVLAEWFFGAGKGMKDVIYVTMSTGVGGGIVSGGKLITGATGNAGEIGHMILDVNGPMCGCGMRGCFEAYCGGKSVARRLQDILRFMPDHAMYRLPCVDGKLENLNFQAIREGAKAGIPLAVEMWDEICMRLAQGLGMCMSAYNPELITLGTSAYYAGDFMLKPVMHYLPRFCWGAFYEHCEIKLSGLGLRIGELAGASVAMHALYQRGAWKPEV